MKSRYCFVVALLMGYCLSALAQQSPRAEKPVAKPFKPGSYVEYVDRLLNQPCKRWRLNFPDSDGMKSIQCDDLLFYTSVENNFNAVKMAKSNGKVLVEFKPFSPDMAFPMEVGKKWTREYTGYDAGRETYSKWDGKVRCEATAFEKIKVAAGEFDSFRIECVEDWKASFFIRGEYRSTRWYAPKIEMIVKLVHDRPEWNFELAGYKFD